MSVSSEMKQLEDKWSVGPESNIKKQTRREREMGSMNKVFLIGRLGRNPEDHMTSAGIPVSNFSLATDHIRGVSGNRERITEWHRVVCFGKLAELSTQYLLKGRLVCVEGSLQTRSWEKAQGEKRYSTEIVASRLIFLESKERGAQSKGENHVVVSELNSHNMASQSKTEPPL